MSSTSCVATAEPRVWYLDTSAFLKLVVAEQDSDAVRVWLANHGPTWSSQLLRTEALRAAIRLGIDDEVVEDALEAVSLVQPATSTFLSAGSLQPLFLRSLDALHLATALELGDDLSGLVTYDERMAEAAASASITVVSPGRSDTGLIRPPDVDDPSARLIGSYDGDDDESASVNDTVYR